MKNVVLGFAFVCIVILTIALAYQMQKNETKLAHPTSAPINEVTVIPTARLVWDDHDAHGCIGSAGYSWCGVKDKCLRLWEEPCSVAQASDAAKIKQALIVKNGWQQKASQVVVAIKTNDGTYASGSVTEKAAEAGGGLFFASKDNGVWKIVADGNGVIECASLVPYPKYPTSLIGECFNSKTGTIVKR